MIQEYAIRANPVIKKIIGSIELKPEDSVACSFGIWLFFTQSPASRSKKPKTLHNIILFISFMIKHLPNQV